MSLNRLYFPTCSGLAVCVVLALSLSCLAGCGKKALPGYGGEPEIPISSTQQPATIDPAALPEGWGYVDVYCFEGVGRERGERDTLFGCLMHARNKGTGTLILPKGVYLGHVADFIARTLKFYHVEEHFEQLYGYRVVLALRPATADEIAAHENRDVIRFAAGAAGEIALTVLGAPFVPIVAPVVFAFEAVDADQEFQAFKREAKAKGLPEPTRRGDEITSDEYVDRYGRYWNMMAGEDNSPKDSVPLMYIVEQCYLAHPKQGRANLVKARESEMTGR